MKLIKLILAMMLLVSGGSYASCYANYTFTRSFSFGNVVVQRDAAVGSTIATVTTYGTGTTNAASCTSSGGSEYWGMTYLGGASAGVYQTYATNIPGVGIRGSGLRSGMYTYPLTNPAYVNYVSGGAFGMGAEFTDGVPVTFQLVKTGEVTTTGPLTTGQVAKTYYDSGTGNIYSLTGGSITALACTLTTPNLTFPIGDVLSSAFGSSVGATPAVAQNTQNLGLNCDSQANISVSLTGTQNPDVGTTSVLALNGQGSAGVAKGVGVQIVYNGTPLTLNNRIVLKRSSGGQEMFPIVARYYQTKTSVATGTANSSATLNLTYQ